MSQSRKQKIKNELIPRKYINKQIIALSCLGLAFLLYLVAKYFFQDNTQVDNVLSFVKSILFVVGLLLVIPFEWLPYIFFDNRDYDKNENIDQLVEKIRFRALLFNNISILVFVFTIGVIIAGFLLLAYPNTKGTELVDVNVRIGATAVLLIFLVQMLFKLFKYLLRVAAFYNGKADAIEFFKMEGKPDMTFEKVIDVFTPEKYDITDMQEAAISSNFIDLLKAKLGIK